MKKGKAAVKKIGPHLVLMFFAFTALFPLSLVLVNSFKQHAEVVRNPLALPASFQWANYEKAWVAGKFASGFVNSILLSGCTILIVLVAASLAGYVIAGKKIRSWPYIMLYFMVAMTVPIQLFLFPLYYVLAHLHLIGNIYAVSFILAAVNMPLSVFLLRTFFLNVPYELEEAAKIDGAGTFAILRHIVLPTVSPGLITVGVIVGLQTWNEFLITSTFLQGESSFTATLGFLSMNGTYTVDQGLMMAAAVVMIVPIIVLFLTVQRYFIDGLVSGSVKG